jgi:hypothetical protein
MWVHGGAGGCEMGGCGEWDIVFGEKRGLEVTSQLLCKPADTHCFTPASSPVSEGPANRSIVNALAL